MKKINKIIFFINNEENEEKEATYVLFSDDKELFLTKTDGIYYVEKLISQEEMTFEQLQEIEKISFMEEEKFNQFFQERNYSRLQEKEEKIKQKEIKKQQKITKKENKKLERENTKEERKERNLKIRRSFYLFTLVSSIIAVCMLANQIKKSSGLFDELLYDNNEYPKLDEDNIDDMGRFYALMNSDRISAYRKLFLEKNYNYLLNYNTKYSNLHMDSHYDSKLSHSWDEIEVLQILYNNYNEDDIRTIFGKSNIKENIYDDYLNELKQEEFAHVVQTTPLNKEDLITSEIGKSFYKKYESIIIKFNNSTDKKEKINLAKDFYRNTKNDFSSNELNMSESYKLSVIPCIMAMNKLCNNLDKDFILQDTDIKYYSNFCQNKLISIGSIISNNNVYTNSDEKITYDDMKIAAIVDLKDIDAYPLYDSSRSIGTHLEYQNRINWMKDTNKDSSTKRKLENEEKNKTKNKDNGINSEIEKQNKSEEKDNKEEIKDSEIQKTEKKKNKEETNKKKANKEENTNKIDKNSKNEKEKNNEKQEDTIENIDIDNTNKIDENINDDTEQTIDYYEEDIEDIDEYDSIITGSIKNYKEKVLMKRIV